MGIMLVRNWGRMGTRGRELAQEFATEGEAAEALELLTRAKRRRGYRDVWRAHEGDSSRVNCSHKRMERDLKCS